MSNTVSFNSNFEKYLAATLMTGQETPPSHKSQLFSAKLNVSQESEFSRVGQITSGDPKETAANSVKHKLPNYF